ncbi:hypothetical protein LPJ38_01755 [Bradyrhizobium daqingense]|uniref:Uncharacterized protein n=1 Tax=Bradyrhizobium daqingense TaxID=993502 RepID=A0A562KCP1_9BRAD|nr:hypothetical protein [Bradyrhizobium daqingense]TWH92985.1 hypothetical protein IQ17_07074 [Bradyrhizobium daqingense]UFS89542.1 hypothetical protein LPJ38_01755 [Bradyrhizobium daqingense]
MNLRSRSTNEEDKFLLFVQHDRSPEDAEAERILLDFLEKSSAKATLLVDERRDADSPTPALYAHFGYFAGLEEIKAFVEVERQLIPLH